ncbi:unnamed protein product [Orchesella dallaii]|uniref:Peptidase S1 domain-containing protein n=1 Tax=Orchesella dallaii TaxID=48710 RepID=A0ABP1QK94_9HEXA
MGGFTACSVRHILDLEPIKTFESIKMRLLSVVLVSVCLPGILGYDYGVAPSYPAAAYSSYSPPAPSYSYSPPAYTPPAYNPPPYYAAPTYSPPSYQPSYSPPTYYETYDTQVDYKEANSTRHCGILPTVHSQYGYLKDRVSFGEYPWQVQILDNYNNYKCAGGLLSPRHVITSAYCVDNIDVYTLRVRVGDWDIQSDKNYQEVYKNYELTVCKKHPFYPIPGYYGYDSSASYPVVILELYADVDLDQYPHVEPLCVPEYYYLSKSYTNEYSYSYGYGSQYGSASPQPAPGPQERNEEGADKDLECIVLGHQESPVEKLEYQSSSPAPQYGYGYQPPYSYESYEYSRTPRRAKIHKVYSYTPQYSSYGYGYTPKVDTWEPEYYFDACHADLGSPIFCLVEGKYEEEQYYPAYPPTYNPPTYTPTYTPTYEPTYNPPPYYSPPSYSPPQYTPSYNPPPYYSPAPSYDYPKYKRQAPYYSPPAYSPPSYAPTYSPPSYTPTYSPPAYTPTYTPTYNPPPYYEESYKYPIKYAEDQNREYRRAVLYGVVQYPTQCSYGYGASGNKITATPAKDLVAWIENVLHTPASCSSYSSYYSPVY